MELRAYAAVLWRRLWILLLVVGVVVLYVGYQLYQLQKTPGALQAYHSQVIMRIGLTGVPPEENVTRSQPERPTIDRNQIYGDYLITAEALADEFTTGPVLSSSAFTTQVYQQIQSNRGKIIERFGSGADTGPVSPENIAGALSASRTHTLVTIEVAWSTPAGAWAIAQAVSELCSQRIGNYVNYAIVENTATATTPQVAAQIINPASSPERGSGTGSKRLLMLLLMVLVALLAAIALAFLVEYLDDRIHSENEIVELLQLPSYGAIPNPPRKGRAPH